MMSPQWMPRVDAAGERREASDATLFLIKIDSEHVQYFGRM